MSSGSASLLSGFAFLILGVIELALAQRYVYPALRWRHERAKLTQSQGMEPNRIMTLLRVQSLVIMPVLGFLLGDRLKAMMG
ncbi:MAG: hypothetical protein HY245_03880 [Rhizobiales bacterium]|nr:hypothetical protein [Hyphomicrobiales bacterium]MBI3672561.1 hypothetical protein [Hyphomicrobiales bacterium]